MLHRIHLKLKKKEITSLQFEYLKSQILKERGKPVLQFRKSQIIKQTPEKKTLDNSAEFDGTVVVQQRTESRIVLEKQYDTADKRRLRKQASTLMVPVQS